MDEQKLLQDISREVRKARQALKISQEELADRANLDRSYLSEIESGKKNISVVVLVKLARALDVPVGQILRR